MALFDEGASEKFDVVAIVASSKIKEGSSTYKFLKDQLSPLHTSRYAVILLDCWRDGWGYGTTRSVRQIENFVRSLGFDAGSIMLRMVYDPRCPITVSRGPWIENLSAAEVKNAGFVLIVGGNGQALLQAAFTKAASSVVEAIAAAIADPSCRASVFQQKHQ